MSFFFNLFRISLHIIPHIYLPLFLTIRKIRNGMAGWQIKKKKTRKGKTPVTYASYSKGVEGPPRRPKEPVNILHAAQGGVEFAVLLSPPV